MGRACRMLSRWPAFAGAHGLHLPGERFQAVQWSQDQPHAAGRCRYSGGGQPTVGLQRQIAGRLSQLMALMGHENRNRLQNTGVRS